MGAVAAFCGLVVYGGAAVLHPWTAPHETEAAFADYAGERGWALIHLAELLGILLMCVAAVALAWRLRRGVAGVWAVLAAGAMLVCASAYAVFIAVDGVALGILVDRWAGAAADQRELLYEAAFAVRQVEAGLFGIQWLLFGIAAGLFGLAFFASAASPFRATWFSAMGWLSALASAGTLVFGITQARTGFSEVSMASQTGLYTGVVWILAVGLFLYRHPEHAERPREAP